MDTQKTKNGTKRKYVKRTKTNSYYDVYDWVSAINNSEFRDMNPAPGGDSWFTAEPKFKELCQEFWNMGYRITPVIKSERLLTFSDGTFVYIPEVRTLTLTKHD